MRPRGGARKTLPKSDRAREDWRPMGIFSFGRGNKGGGDETPPRIPDSPPPSGDDSRGSDSFLTGDERTDAKNVSMLLDTIAAVNSTIDLDKLLVSIVDKAITVTRSERGFLLLRDGDAGELSTRVARDAAGRDLPRDTRFSTKVLSQVESSRAPVTSMVNSDAKALELSQSVFDLKIRAVMCVPLLVKGKFTGAIYVDSRVVQREFTRADLKFFDAFGGQAAVALENARLLRDSIEKERMAQELRIAQQIQKRMLPSGAPTVGDFEFGGLYEPASEAAGDSYDFIQIDDHRIAFVVTDVSGHGIGPALVTMASRARMRSYLKLGIELGDAIGRLNSDMNGEVEAGLFQTLFAGIVDTKNGTLQYVNAGHPPALMRRAGDGSWIELSHGGAALGIVDFETYTPSPVVEWRPGDVVVAYTDGITEARPAGGSELFGEANLKKTVAGAAARSAPGIGEALVEAVRQFCNGPSPDDLTLVTIRRRP